MALEFVELEYENGAYRIVMCPPAADLPLLRVHHDKLFAAIGQSQKWPPDLQGSEGDRLDDLLYQLHGHYFHRIARLIKADDVPLGEDWVKGMTPESRHRFFVGNEEIVAWNQTDVDQEKDGPRMIPGLSYFSQLIGIEYPSGEPAGKPPDCTSGDSLCDLVAALALSFEGTPPSDFTSHYSMDFLSKMLEQAGCLREKAQEAAKEKDKKSKQMAGWAETQETPEDEDFTLKKGLIMEQLRSMEIEFPEGF